MASAAVSDHEVQVLRAVAGLFDEEALTTVLPEHVLVPGLSEAQVATALQRLVRAGYLVETGLTSFAAAAAGVGIDGITDQGRQAAQL
jgi:hypothetical protein